MKDDLQRHFYQDISTKTFLQRHFYQDISTGTKMPRYDYQCDSNGRVLEVTHAIAGRVQTWGELCEMAGVEPGDTALDSSVRKIITAPPMANTPKGDSYLKNQGFTKLVKRSDGTYENVTRTGTEKRFLDPKDPSSMPHLNKKITD